MDWDDLDDLDAGNDEGGKRVVNEAPIYQPEEAAGLGARVEFALVYARLRPMQLRDRLLTDYGISMSRTNTYKLVGGQIRRTKYFMEIAEVCGVSAKWLATGKSTMVDMTGRLSNREEAARDVRRLLTQYVIPPNRNDIVRLHGRLVSMTQKGSLTPDVVRNLMDALDLFPEDL